MIKHAWRFSVPLPTRARTFSSAKVVNATYRPSPQKPLVPNAERAGGDTKLDGLEHVRGSIGALLERHSKETWSRDEFLDSHSKHAVFGWGTNTDAAHQSALSIARAEGVYLIDQNGRKIFDMNAGGMCVNMGHTLDELTLELITKQLQTLTYAWPDSTITPVRARLSQLLADVMPGDLNHFIYPSSGAEANEAIVRIARVVTGREKVMSCYRGYHGGTSTTLAMTGDSRRWAAERGAAGHIHFHHAYPYSFSRYARPTSKWAQHAGQREAELECAERALAGLREQILVEGAHTIALIHHEGVTGSNGTIAHPPGYLEGVRELCNQHGIMMGIDEVMSGWGRTGKLFGFQHSDGVVPDLVATAKGLNSAVLPLGMVAMRDHVADALQHKGVAIGSTYTGHPVALASAYGIIQMFLKKDVLGHVRVITNVVEECMQELAEKHPSVKQARTIGLLGSIDIQRNLAGDFIVEPWEPPHPKMLEFRTDLINRGAWTLVKGHSVFVCPPLIITEKEVKEMFKLVDASMHILDEAMEHESDA